MQRAGVLLPMAMLAACGINEEGGREAPDMNMQEAAEFADRVMKGTIVAAQPPLEWTHQDSSESDCSDALNEPTGTGSVTRRAVIMTIVSEERRGSLLDVIERHWKKSGYEITSVQHHPQNPSMYATTPEGFRIGLLVGYQGQFFLDVATPCVTKSEVAPPGTFASGRDYGGGEVPLPNRESEFWSTSEPLSAGG